MAPPHALSATNLLSLFFFLILLATQAADAKIRRYKWEVNYQFKSPDCYKKLAIAINGRTPGPTILAQQEDSIIVEPKNSLVTENIAIHWHGIRQIDNSVLLLREDCGTSSLSIDGYSQLLVAISRGRT